MVKGLKYLRWQSGGISLGCEYPKYPSLHLLHLSPSYRSVHVHFPLLSPSFSQIALADPYLPQSQSLRDKNLQLYIIFELLNRTKMSLKLLTNTSREPFMMVCAFVAFVALNITLTVAYSCTSITSQIWFRI